MKVLGPFVDRLRRQRQTRKIPAFDPADGGSVAKVLFLLEAPGPGAVRSGLISRNNKDETAAIFNGLLAEAGIAPAETLLWNVVPWYIGNDEGTKIRPARVADLREAAEHLIELLRLLPSLRAVVLVGRKAQHRSVAALIADTRPGVAVFECYHPSPLVLRGRPRNRAQILGVLKDVRKRLDGD